MRVTDIRLTNFRAYVDTPAIELGPITVLIGHNNAGKSTVLRGLHVLQQGHGVGANDARNPALHCQITLGMADLHGLPVRPNRNGQSGSVSVTISPGSSRAIVYADGTADGFGEFSLAEPHHFVIPFLSKRKTAAFNEDVRQSNATQVSTTLAFLPAKLSRLSNTTYPAHAAYVAACKAILGFEVFCIPGESGQRVGIYVDSHRTIPIEQMGDGVPHIIGLLVDLCSSTGKLFLIEEPENDLHPLALKALLELILESSTRNQFVISTHSSIVLRHLGAAPETRLYRVDRIRTTWPPEGQITEIENTAQDRLQVLADLGYNFSDFELFDGWLILEESSAQRIIHDYLIPAFAPKLARVRIVAAQGVDDVEPSFKEFNRLFRFTHLETAYKGKVWVRVDGDEQGKTVVAKLRADYKSWAEDRFDTFSEAQFERYYPEPFTAQVTATLAIQERQAKRSAKKALLDAVVAYIEANKIEGMALLEKSAAPVIAELREIEKQLLTVSDQSCIDAPVLAPSKS